MWEESGWWLHPSGISNFDENFRHNFPEVNFVDELSMPLNAHSLHLFCLDSGGAGTLPFENLSKSISEEIFLLLVLLLLMAGCCVKYDLGLHVKG